VINRSYGYVLKHLQYIWNSIICKKKLRLSHEEARRISNSNKGTQYLLECLGAKWDWQMGCAEDVITWLETYAEYSPIDQNFDIIPVNVMALVRICEQVSRILIQQLNIASADLIVKWDWQIVRDWSVVTRLMTDWQFPCVPGTGWIMLFHCVDFETRMWPQASCVTPICNWQILWSPLLHHTQHSTYTISRGIGQPGTDYVAHQFTSSHIHHY